MTKYKELLQADEKATQAFKDYERDCKVFIRKLRNNLVEFLECPNNKVIWAKFSDSTLSTFEQEDGFLECAVNRMMILFDDNYYTFEIKILLSPDNDISSNAVGLRFKVKKLDECFVVHHDKDDISVHEGSQKEMNDLIEFIFKGMKTFLGTRFDDFIKGEQSSLGFIKT